VMRVPLMHGLPIMTAGSEEMRGCVMSSPVSLKSRSQPMIAENSRCDKTAAMDAINRDCYVKQDPAGRQRTRRTAPGKAGEEAAAADLAATLEPLVDADEIAPGRQPSGFAPEARWNS